MRFGFNFGLLGGTGGGATPNLCITVGSDAVGAGFYHPAYGSATPTHTDSGLLFYSFTWYTNGSSSTINISFGDNGDEEVVTYTQTLLITINGKKYHAHWNTGLESYRLTNQALVDDLTLLADGEELCIFMGLIPDNFISYDFAIERGDQGC